MSHVTSDEAIVPFRRLNSYEERNLRSAVEVAALVNGRALAFCAAEVKYFSPPDGRDDRSPSTIEGLLCNSVESSLLESTYRRENFLAVKKKKKGNEQRSFNLSETGDARVARGLVDLPRGNSYDLRSVG